MEVILVQPVKKLGNIGKLVNVKTGFGRNYLIPNNLAIRATEENKKLIEQKRSDLDAKNSKAKQDAEKTAKSIEGKELIFVRQTSADGRLFGSVNAKEIAKSVSELAKTNVYSANIILEAQIKYIGVYKLEVALHPEVHAHLLIVVERSEAEAKSALSEYRNPKPVAAESKGEEK